jgi:hypothetical protein
MPAYHLKIRMLDNVNVATSHRSQSQAFSDDTLWGTLPDVPSHSSRARAGSPNAAHKQALLAMSLGGTSKDSGFGLNAEDAARSSNGGTGGGSAAVSR